MGFWMMGWVALVANYLVLEGVSGVDWDSGDGLSSRASREGRPEFGIMIAAC